MPYGFERIFEIVLRGDTNTCRTEATSENSSYLLHFFCFQYPLDDFPCRNFSKESIVT